METLKHDTDRRCRAEAPRHDTGHHRPLLAVAMTVVLAGCPSAAPQAPGSGPAKGKVKTSMANYPSPKPREDRRLRFRALTVDMSKRQGEVVNVSLSVGPNRPGRVDITISESLAGGTGNTLRASLWMAAFQASTMVGRPLIQYSISLGCDGAVDGSSMGVLLTAALMAAMTGVEIKPDVSLTGSLLPDGTVGPVGGLPQKLEAALDKGIKVVGYPLGQRMARDLRTGEMVDLEKFAADRGARAVELSSINDAFTLLTGRSYPRPEPLPAAEMALTPEMNERLKQAATPIIESSLKGVAAVARKPGATRELRKRLERARELLLRAQKKLAGGRPATALVLAQRGRALAYATYLEVKYHKLLKKPDEKPLAEIIGEVRKLLGSVREEANKRRYSYQHSFTESHWSVISFQWLMGSFVTSLKAGNLATEGIAMARVMRGKKPLPTPPGGYLSKAQAAQVEAYNKSLAKLDKKQLRKQLPELVRAALGYKALGWSLLETARDFALVDPKGAETAANQTQRLNEMMLEDLSKMYVEDARANLVYYESVVKLMVAGRQMPREELILHSHVAELAAGAWAIPDQVVAPRWGEKSASTAMVRLAGAKESWLESAVLIYRSFYPTLENKRASEGILRRADLIVRRYARAAKKLTGTVPMSARVFYQAAVDFYRSGDEMAALEWGWRAALEADFSILLARIIKKSDREPPSRPPPKRMPAPTVWDRHLWYR